jgi:TRAP-type C4-dicarboxylate transport system substrate-binding protein
MTQAPARRRLLMLGAAAMAAPAVLRIPRANAQEVTLRLHHFLPAVSNVHRHFLMPWAQKVQQESGGTPPHPDLPGHAARRRAARSCSTRRATAWRTSSGRCPGNTPGRFPRIEVFELPFVAHATRVPNAKAVLGILRAAPARGVPRGPPHLVWAHDAGVIHANREVATLEDMRGLKLRFPTRQAGEALRALGAAPDRHADPAGAGGAVAARHRRRRRAVGGRALHPLQELVRHHTEIPGSPTLYTPPSSSR